MGLLPEVSLDDGEEVVEQWNANRTQGWRAVSGRLWLTTTHLRFAANAVDRATGGQAWAVPLTEIREVEVAPRSLRGGGPFLPGLRKRLAVRLADGTEELFLVNRLAERIERLRAAL